MVERGGESEQIGRALLKQVEHMLGLWHRVRDGTLSRATFKQSCCRFKEPTNNCAERGLRRAVLWRRRCFGTRSEDGSHLVERVLTAVTTLRQQIRDVLDYLTQACAAAIRHDAAPSLLPIAAILNTGV